jgi:hypothetical protein
VKKQYLLLFLLLLCPIIIFAQTKKKRVKRSNSLHFNFVDSSVDSLENAVMTDGFVYAGVNLMNHVTTLGRDNNVDQWGISPIIGVHKYNFDVYVNGFRWSETVPTWAETDIGISKSWQLSNQFSAVANYEHAFVHYGNEDDQFGLNNLFALQGIWTNKYFETTARYEYDWGTNSASILEFSVAHQFDLYNVFLEKDKIEITPRGYWTHLGGATYPAFLFTSNAVNAQTFQVANYGLELPITWRKVGDMELELSFLYDIPQNVLADEGSGKPIFYVTASLVKLFRL